jgi:hypothetical protein
MPGKPVARKALRPRSQNPLYFDRFVVLTMGPTIVVDDKTQEFMGTIDTLDLMGEILETTSDQ